MSGLLPYLAVASIAIAFHFLAAFGLRWLVSRDAVVRYYVDVVALLCAPLVVSLPLLLARAPHSPIGGERPSQEAMTHAPPASEPSHAAAVSPLGSAPAAWQGAVSRLNRLAESRPLPRILIGLYLVGASIVFSRYLLRLMATWRLVRASEATRDPRVLRCLEAALLTLGIRRQVRVRQSARLHGTACADILPATILLPADPPLNDSDLRCALLHELIHIRRADGLVAILQGIMTGLFWFHPVVGWFNRMANQDRETSCDATLVRITNQPRSYATALLNQFELGLAVSAQSLALHHIHGTPSARFFARRLQMLRHAKTQTTRTHVLAVCACGLGVLALSMVIQTRVVGQLTSSSSTDSGTSITEVHAPEGDRSDAAVGNKWRSYGEQTGDPHILSWFQPDYRGGGPLRDQESFVSTERGVVTNNELVARQVLVNLPEGSRLVASIAGEHVQLQPTPKGSELTIRHGSLSVHDREGTRRLIAEAAEGAALVARMELAGNEVSFKLTALTEDRRAADVRVSMDLTTGIPQDEDNPPHGSNRYSLNLEHEDQPGEVVLKMQWVYDIARLRHASR